MNKQPRELPAQILNPCKHCLTRPVCRKECSDFTDHRECKEILFLICMTLLISIFYAVTCVCYWIMINTTVVKVTIGLITTICYIKALSSVVNNYSEFTEFTLTEKLSFLVVGPFAEFTAFIYYKTRIDSWVEEHAYRYIKSIWNKKYPKGQDIP